LKEFGKIFLILFVAAALAGLSGCSEKEKSSSEDGKKTAEAKASAEADAKNTPSDPKEQEKEVQDFVLKNTKIVKIYNISKRINEKHPTLGPFFVVRGIDERGQKSELWIKDMKIFEMVSSN
jgi:uncharacterized protein YpmB